jgi:hypothetical protein
MIEEPLPSNGSRIITLTYLLYPRAGLLSLIMLSLYALLFFALGSSVVALPVAHPIAVTHPTAVTHPIAELQRLLEDQGCAGPTAWFQIESGFKKPVSGTKLLISCVSHTSHRIRIAQSMSIMSSSSLQINSQEWALCLKTGNLVKGNLSRVI